MAGAAGALESRPGSQKSSTPAQVFSRLPDARTKPSPASGVRSQKTTLSVILIAATCWAITKRYFIAAEKFPLLALTSIGERGADFHFRETFGSKLVPCQARWSEIGLLRFFRSAGKMPNIAMVKAAGIYCVSGVKPAFLPVFACNNAILKSR